MRTRIYIDGFNLYYGALKNISFKWLDLSRLFRPLLKPNHNILKIKYFTAHISILTGGLKINFSHNVKTPILDLIELSL